MINKLKSKIKKSKIIIHTFKTIFMMVGLLPKNKKLIIFESFNGRQFSDNPRAIYEYLKDNYPDYRMVWSVDKRHLKNFSNHEIEIAKKFSLKWFYLFPIAKYWVSNSRLPLWFPKSKRTVYLQTWHGTPLKKLGVDIEDVKIAEEDTLSYKRDFVKESSKWDYLISPNKYSTEIFKRAFGYNNQIIETGYPRNDILINQNNPKSIERIKKETKLPLDKKVILYAPTWRDDEYDENNQYKFKIHLDLEKMKEEFGEEYIVVLRLHYLVSEKLELANYEGFVYDFSSYEDIRELYLISDLLITDYSSVFFDYAILERPILFFVYDIENYRDNLRGFYFDFENNAPGPLLKTNSELINEIKQIEGIRKDSMKRIKEFKQTFSSLEDGKATKRVVESILNK